MKDFLGFSAFKTESGKIDYRHIVCWAITLVFLACTAFIFPTGIGRLIESFRDVGLSLAYYVMELLGYEGVITPTVTALSKYPVSPFFSLADDWIVFKADWSKYWSILFTAKNFRAYFFFLLTVLYWISNVMLIVVPLVFLIKILIGRAFNQVVTEHKRVSKPLMVFYKFEIYVYYPIKKWIQNFFAFIKDNSKYYIVWLCIWGVNFNLFTIILEFLAFYFYFVISFDLIEIYKQVYKLVLDLSPMVRFVPLIIWLLIGFVILNLVCRSMGFDELRHGERKNRGFVKERGVVTVIYGEPGAGKTAQCSDMLLSAEVQLRDDALEVILECDMKFPNFPWRQFEDDLKWAIRCHVVYDKWSCLRWVAKKEKRFLKNPCIEKLYGYDYVRYGIDYDDNLKIENLWDVLRDYACAYMIYTVQSSLLITNFSVRTDNLYMDLGNFPRWNCDFFARDSRLLDSFSRHSHILDQDMFRLGKIMLENNPNRNALGFGVYGVTEIDKERKNTPGLMEVRISDDKCNQKNDLYNTMLKMIRHACVIGHRVFVRIIADLQRPESLGADTRELGQVMYIDSDSSGMRPVLPFFSPFWCFELIYLRLWSKFEPFYLNAIYMRGDQLLRVYIVKNIMAKMKGYYDRVCNLYGRETLKIEIQSGKMDGKVKIKKYYRQSKKIWSNRYSTDCLSGIFESRAENNYVGINDLREYANVMATQDELLAQHSHMQEEINTLGKVAV